MNAEGEKSSSPPPRRSNHQKVSRTQMTRRDVQVISALALARYLSTDQLCRLFFTDCIPKVAVRRLRMLSGGGATHYPAPMLRRVRGRADDGAPIAVWALTDRGYAVASDKLGFACSAPRRDIGELFVRHTLELNELFVRMLRRHLEVNRPGLVGTMAVRWRSADTLRLRLPPPELSFRRTAAEYLQPDAMLELPKSQARVFIEYETGSQPLVSKNKNRIGATEAKLKRYLRYLVPSDGRDAPYRSQFPDGLQAEVLFLCRTEDRAKAVAELIAKTRAGKSALIQAWALAPACVAHEDYIGPPGMVPAAAAPQAGGAVGNSRGKPPEAESLAFTFYTQALSSLKDARDTLRAVNQNHGTNYALPPYPACAPDFKAILQRTGVYQL